MLLNKSLALKGAVVLAFITSFAFSAGGGHVFADDPSASTTDNSVAADNTGDQSAVAGPADTTTPTDNSQTDNTPAVGDPTPPATDNTTPTTDPTTGSTTPAPLACTPATTDPSADPASDPSGSGQTNVNNNSTINNNDCAAANSGNAGVTNNNSGGNATSGDASDEATLINILQSLTGLSGGALATFIQNIGDQTGDITIDPALLAYLSGASNSCGCGGAVSINNNGTINNNIDMTANSGNADVSNNGTGGNATTGDANVLLNLVNIINSIVSANKSFIGIININGNLNGDILLPPGLLNLLGSNAPPPGGGSGGGSQTDINNTQGINNNVNLSAQTGNADVSGNGSGGNATTGNAKTNLTLLNMTGSDIIGSNAILVFVNVLGQWFGMIVNAPAGATSAALGDGSSTGGSICGCNSGGSLTINNNSQINNNINLASQTGNASVTGNGSGGNATSGNATTSANIINIINSDIALNGWFGILFINVFGTWTGSFGIDTSAGDPPATPPSDGGSGQGVSGGAVVAATSTGGYGGGNNGYGAGNTQTSDNSGNNKGKVVLGAKSGNSNTPLPEASKLPNLVVGAITGLCCFLLLGMVERRQNKKAGLQMPTETIEPGLQFFNQ